MNNLNTHVLTLKRSSGFPLWKIVLNADKSFVLQGNPHCLWNYPKQIATCDGWKDTSVARKLIQSKLQIQLRFDTGRY